MSDARGPQLVPNVYEISKSQDFTTDFKISSGISRDFKISIRDFRISRGISIRFQGISGFQEGFQDLKSQDFTPDFAFQQISRFLLDLYNISATVYSLRILCIIMRMGVELGCA